MYNYTRKHHESPKLKPCAAGRIPAHYEEDAAETTMADFFGEDLKVGLGAPIVCLNGGETNTN